MEAFFVNAAANATGTIMADSIEEIRSYVWGDLTRSPNTAFERLRRQAALLRSLRDHNEKLRQSKKKITSSYYDNWLTSVYDILKEVEEALNDVNESVSRERVEQIMGEVLVLQQHGKFQEGFWVDKPPEPVVKMSPPNIQHFPSLQEPLKRLLQLLSSDGVKAIGIYGLPGVGKTTIMQNLNDHEQVAITFEIVIWMKVSKKTTREKLQRDIARRLKLNLPAGIVHSDDEVAESISEWLKDKKFLLLLDDVKETIDLQAIGIPQGHPGSKVVLTTEFRHVICNNKDIKSMIEVNPLSMDEAWVMFEQIASDKIDLPDVEPVARQVAEECYGFPILINTVANSFKKKNSVAEWRDGLEELRNWSEVEIPKFTEIHSIIKFCCDNVKGEQERRCFLYGAMHPADTKISTDYLVKCWAAERFLGEIDNRKTFQSACDKGYRILGDLADVSLLQTDKRMEHVQVNNMVRQVARHISSEEHDCKFLIGGAKTSSSLQEVNGWEQATRIFMIDMKLDQLPITPRCSVLLSLLLQRNVELKTIPPLFFRAMKKLQVLNLHRTGIETLPRSVGSLTALKALFLNSCPSLTSLPLQVDQLCFLEVLDIRRCNIIFIPHSIGDLAYLRCLRLSYYKPSTVNGSEEMQTDCNVFSRLSRLEELAIDVVSYVQWCREAAEVIQKVACLENLTSLKLHFPRLEVLQTLLDIKPDCKGRKQLTSMWTFIACPSSNPPEILEYFDYKINRYLRYCPDGYEHDYATSNYVFPETDALELIGHENITCLSKFLETPGLNGVRGCLVEGCSNMVTIVDRNNVGGANILLPSLEQLHMRNLPDLISVFQGTTLSQGSLLKLHTVVVKYCPALTKICSSGLTQQLPRLKKLVVQDCSAIEELIENSGNGSMQNLEVLELHDLPELATIVDQGASFSWPQLKKLLVYQCPKLRKLPFNEVNADELRLIEGEQVWWSGLVWERIEFQAHFQSIFKVRSV